jgi:hypothetical protein
MLGTVKILGADATANSGALAATLQVTTSRARLFSVTMLNTGPNQWIQFHDSAAIPAGGAVPKVSLPVLAGQFLTDDFLDGRLFINGIFIGNSTTAATYTAGAADQLIDATYRKDW